MFIWDAKMCGVVDVGKGNIYREMKGIGFWFDGYALKIWRRHHVHAADLFALSCFEDNICDDEEIFVAGNQRINSTGYTVIYALLFLMFLIEMDLL